MMNGSWDGSYSRMLTIKRVWSRQGSIIIPLPAWLLASLLLPSISHHRRLEKFPPGFINMREILWKTEAVWRREVMAEGRNQACKDWHKQLSAWRGARAMKVTATGKGKEIPGNFSLYGCSSPRSPRRSQATFNLLWLKHLGKLWFSSGFYTTFYTAFILPLTALIRLWKDKKTF